MACKHCHQLGGTLEGTVPFLDRQVGPASDGCDALLSTVASLLLQVQWAASTCFRCTPQQAIGASLPSHTSRLTLNLVRMDTWAYGHSTASGDVLRTGLTFFGGFRTLQAAGRGSANADAA
jgi:hypothetical protein